MFLPAFHKYPKEAEIIGRLVAGYSEIELALLNCVANTTGDFNTTLKVMFTHRFQDVRVQMADILARQIFNDTSLKQKYEASISCIRCCQKIRNQYAHCYFYDDNLGTLAFIDDLQKIAQKNKVTKDFSDTEVKYLPLGILEKQESFFSIHTKTSRLAQFRVQGKHG